MVIFFDIDGTIIDDKTNEIPDSTIRAVEALAEIGISESLLRLSVGLEDADDLIADLKAELDRIEV